MEDYETLLQQILSVPQLVQQVETFAKDQNALNLVTENWMEVLENHKPFQEFQQNGSKMFTSKYSSANSVFHVQQLKDHVTPLRVIVAGFSRMYKPYDENTSKKQSLAITLNESPIMDMLTKAFTTDLDSEHVQLNPTCRLNFKHCSMFCNVCSNSHKEMIANRVRVNSKYIQPCIIDTSVYDGKSIVNRFGSQILEFFPGNFLTITKIELNVRYFYIPKEEEKEIVRVGGLVLKMVGFPESNLKQNIVDLGDLHTISEAEVETGDTSLPEEELESLNKRPLFEETENNDEDDEIIDALPAEKKQKTCEDDFEITEDACFL